MKKILPYILIITIFANFFAPISASLDNNYGINITRNTASAATVVNAFPSSSIGSPTLNQAKNVTSAEVALPVTLDTGVDLKSSAVDNWLHTSGIISNFSYFGKNNFVLVVSDGDATDPKTSSGYIDVTNQLLTGITDTKHFDYRKGTGVIDMPHKLSTSIDISNNLTPIIDTGMSSLQPGITYNIGLYYQASASSLAGGIDILKNGSTYFNVASTSFTTVTKGTTGVANNGKSIADVPEVNPDPMPDCGIVPGLQNGTVGGCAAQLIYYVLFVPTSYVFALAGKFFDFTFAYSINDTSYRSAFVVQGWGIVRDFCNMFFIFVLLYIAFATILNLHGFKTKEMVINVVIIGILINFSLFATQLIIDTSNILARVFYSSNVIKITQNGANGVTDATTVTGPNGEIPLSAAIVNKVNPQNLIIHANTVGNIPDKGGKITQTNLGVGTFIVVTLLATAVNIVGLIVFLSVGLIFVARVIGLWMAMIFVPLAFFSYTVPSMQDVAMIGWKKWWPETIRLAFLAPIFIFFMYIILNFLNTGLSLISSSGQTGVSYVVAIVVPFIFIMILLMKAKDIAKEFSGSLGQSITNGIAAVGGVAIGGAALGTAFLGRSVIGRGVAAMSNTEGAINRGAAKISFNKKLDDWKAKGGEKSGIKAPTWKEHKKEFEKETGKEVGTGIFSRIGNSLNTKQKEVEKVDHARHEIDTIKEKAGFKDINLNKLSGTQKEKVETTFKREKRSEVETEVRKGVDATGKKIELNTSTGGRVVGEEEFKKAERGNVRDEYMQKNSIQTEKDLTDADKKNIENDLNVKFNNQLKIQVEAQLGNKFAHLMEESTKNVGGLTRAFTKSNTGSYDVRNLSSTKSDRREGLFTKASTALISGVALGVRTGLKNSGVNHGTGQKDFLKDIGSTITEALKNVKVEVPKASSGGHGGGDSHGGGGDHGHGGGGHH